MILASIPVNYGLVFILPFTLLLLGKVKTSCSGCILYPSFFLRACAIAVFGFYCLCIHVSCVLGSEFALFSNLEALETLVCRDGEAACAGDATASA